MNTETKHRIMPVIGNVYFLKNYTAPKVFTGHHFECALTHQYLTSNIKILQDLGPLKDWPHEVWRPERFNGLGIEAKSPEAESRGLEADSPADRQPSKSESLPQETTTQNIKTPTLQEIKDQLAQEEGYESFDLMFNTSSALKEFINKAILKGIEADRKDCAEKARVKPSPLIPSVNVVDQDSILNRPLPPMQ